MSRGLQQPVESFRDAVLRGLALPNKSIPSRFFYDSVGSMLFERITTLDEYYPTRTELSILQQRAGEIAARLGSGVRLIEFGSGSGVKTRLLLDALRAPSSYVPIDISAELLEHQARSVAEAYPDLLVQPHHADFSSAFRPPAEPQPSSRTVVFFPGSTLGNFTAEAAQVFLRRAAELCGAGGRMVLGIDPFPAVPVPQPLRHKREADVLAAYDDVAGVTAAFNRNLLVRMRRELGAEVDPEAFSFVPRYDARCNRIESYLVSQRAQHIGVDGQVFTFRAGEAIHTENSHKYDPNRLDQLIAGTGFRVATDGLFTDRDGWFLVVLLEVVGDGSGR
ncbi:MAG: L-histidine N(alpha)-methyltransferase [Planctomycetes bacterium]|nr:L-histidine N(alpha)-methyltransferase [Planctomycetota bacterium]